MMYDLRQFKPALYLVLLLGITGYSIAAATPALWVFGCFFVLLHAWLSARGRFKPMPRLLTNIVTLGVLGFVLIDAMMSGNPPVLLVGEFLVLLQMVKLWEQRANRDFAQLLVLGLLLMVAAAISTASLWFGIVLLAYLFLSLYCCLLFHLKVEAEAAKAAIGLPRPALSSHTLRQDERYLPRSMRRLTLLATAVGLGCGVAVFIVFPRGATGGLLGPLQLRAAQVLVGFSDRVSFQNIAKLQQSSETVAWVALSHNGKSTEGSATLLLRGTTLDRYRGNSWPNKAQRYQWLRTDPDSSYGDWRGLDEVDLVAPMQGTRQLDPPSRSRGISSLALTPPSASTRPSDVWEQHIMLRPTGTHVLFAMAGPISIRPASRQLSLRYYRSAQVIETATLLNDAVEYDMVSTNVVGGPLRPPTLARHRKNMSEIDPQIAAMARRPEVSGTNADGPLAAQRDPMNAATSSGASYAAVHALDEQIAGNIVKFLRSNYRYTLDLTDTRQIEGRDPLVAFLTDFKRGHCEYFAGAMTVLCQSLGLQARMIAGFHCEGDSYVNGYYLVQQSHAHAWVEVLTPGGWKTFDPTSSIGAPPPRPTFWQMARKFLNYLDFTYARSVVAYDGDSQTTVLKRAQNGALNAVIRSTSWLDPIRRHGFMRWAGGLLERARNATDRVQNMDAFWTIVLFCFVALMGFSLAAAVAWFVWERYRLRKRAARIGIASLPIEERMRLARQLEFYDELLRLLARHRIHRPRHETPLEFSRSLLFLPAEVYDGILRLTELFYRVRYGGAELTAARRRHLAMAIEQLGEKLEHHAALAAALP